MKFAYFFPGLTPPNPALLSAEALSEVALTAEQAGFSAVALDEHPAPPEFWRKDGAGHDSLDPFVVLASVAAATKRIKLFTHLAVVPYRNPFLLAKAAATLDVVSGGRLMFGLGAGYIEEEFRALGVDFARRNELFDESLEVMKRAFTGEPVTFKGSHFTAEENTVQPVPLQRPHPPFWFGGNSQRALRRVAKHGQGWASMPNARNLKISRHSAPLDTFDDLKKLLGDLRRYAAEEGRTTPIDVLYSFRPRPAPRELLAYVPELRELGVTWLTAGMGGGSREEALDRIRRFGDEVIAKI